MNAILTFLQKRLSEHTTWYGIMLIALSFGLKLSPEQQQAIIYFGMAIAGAPDINLKQVFNRNNGASDAHSDATNKAPTETEKEVNHAYKKKSLDSILDDDIKL